MRGVIAVALRVASSASAAQAARAGLNPLDGLSALERALRNSLPFSHLLVFLLRFKPTSCASTSSRIADPDAFATAFARGVEHPKVREALDMAFDPRRMPRDVTVPIPDLLGPDGHRYCTGWQLEPVDGSMKTAQTNRDSWLAARERGRDPDVPQPRVQPVPTFEGGEIAFFFRRNYAEKRYEIVTMFPRPAADVSRS